MRYLLNALLPSWHLFWPAASAWPDTALVLIWDDESALDREAASNISLLYPEVRLNGSLKPQLRARTCRPDPAAP